MIMVAFVYAKSADLNQGLITAMLSCSCIFTSVIFYFIFNEKLKIKFLIGIVLMITCVALVALSKFIPSEDNSEIIDQPIRHLNDKNISESKDKKFAAMVAIGLGVIAPLLISIFIAVSRYWTSNHGYNSSDYSIDSFMLMGVIELFFFFKY